MTELNDLLESWKNYQYKYVVKKYTTEYLGDRVQIEVVNTFTTAKERIIEKGEFLHLFDYPNYNPINDFLIDCDNKFYRKIQENIDLNWHNTESKAIPEIGSRLDVAYWYTMIGKSNGKFGMTSCILFSEGERKGDRIISDDKHLEFEVDRNNISLYAWRYLD